MITRWTIKPLMAFALISAPTAGLVMAEEVRTVDWWKQHNSEREQLIENCKNDTSLDSSANCRNASRAEYEKDVIGEKGSLKSTKLSLPNIASDVDKE